MSWITLLCLLALLEGCCMELVSSSKLADIYWNASNPIFRIDNTDHIIDVNKGNNPFEYDQVNIICPTYSKGTKEEDTESYIIYNVSKEEYDSCRITNSNARIIAICDKPQQLMYFTITFRSFTPQPGGLEFKPGQDYYFISTSDGRPDGIDHRYGGRCSSHNMKVIFKVCCRRNGVVDSNKSKNDNNKNNKSPPVNAANGGDSPGSSSSSQASLAGNAVKPSILLTTIKSTIVLNNSINDTLLSQSPSDNTRRPILRASTKHPNANRKQNISGHSLEVGLPSRDVGSNSFLINNSIHAANGQTTASPVSQSPTPTPHWWRPHFAVIPGLKHNNNNNNDVPRSDQEWTPRRADDTAKSDSGAWLTGVAVVIACLIVCALYICTNLISFVKIKLNS